MYLALGDSIAMGFNPFLDAHGPQTYVGYPEYLQELIDIPHTNAACFGETTGSFLNATVPDLGCRKVKADGLVRAGCTGTQFEFMIDFIQTHSRVELVAASAGSGGDPCAAGLLIPLTSWNEWVRTAPGASCDSHPTPAGAQLIANTIAQAVPPRAE